MTRKTSRARKTAAPLEGDVATRLLAWYDRHRRELPWRRETSPYRTLLSELMAQQTVLATVVPRFEAFVVRFPDLAALAAAGEDDVLAAWSGLGYYARARNLHRAARAIVEHHGGVMPRDEATLRSLPGVGPYTAAAVAAIVYDVPTFALDGNAARVMARLTAERDPIDGPRTRARLRVAGQELMPRRRAGDFVQAVMELGALVCVPRRPRCEVCPLGARCGAAARGLTATIPAPKIRPTRPVVHVACARVERDGRVLLVRRRGRGLLAGTWVLPAAPLEAGAAGVVTAARAAARAAGVSPGTARRLGEVRHIFTHRDLTADVVAVHERRGASEPMAPAPELDLTWAAARDLGKLALSTFARKTLAVGHRGSDSLSPSAGRGRG